MNRINLYPISSNYQSTIVSLMCFLFTTHPGMTVPICNICKSVALDDISAVSNVLRESCI